MSFLFGKTFQFPAFACAEPVCFRTKSSEQLLSTDTHTNTANYKFTYSVEIVPICKDDLVCIPPKQARSLSNINPLTVCVRVGNSVHLMDPTTLQFCDVPAPVYWRQPFDSLASVGELKEFTILDIEPSGKTKGKWVIADAQVALSGAFTSSGLKQDDMMDDSGYGGSESQIFHTRTHLGAILQPGDSAMGYYVSKANYNSDDFTSLEPSRIPDIVLVKKAYPNRRKKARPRNWQLRSMAKEAGEEGETSNARGVVGRMGGRDQKKVEEDYELFLRELEEDPELRGAVNLYKAKDDGDVKMGAGSGMAGGKTRKKTSGKAVASSEMEIDEELSTTGDEEEDEPDFPEVDLNELLDHFDDMTLEHDEGDKT